MSLFAVKHFIVVVLVVETSRTKLNTKDDEEEPQPARKVIKPDFSLLFNTSTEVRFYLYIFVLPVIIKHVKLFC